MKEAVSISAAGSPETAAESRSLLMLRKAAIVLIGTAILAAAAHIQVPFWPVKLSMQSFVVLAIGLTVGARLAGATLLVYLAEGAAGLPVFQSGSGLAYMAGPTGGFLVGFVFAAVTVGYAKDLGVMKGWVTGAAAILLAIALMYLPGVAWLAVLFGPERAIEYGLTPFLFPEAVKIALLTALLPVAGYVSAKLKI